MRHLRRSQLAMYLEEAGWVLYMRDRAQLSYHFGKLSDDDCRKMLATGEGEASGGTASIRQRAYRHMTRHYGIWDQSTIARDAAREFLAASRAGRVPAWAVGIAPIAEIRAAAG